MTVAPQQLYTFRSSYATLTYSKDDVRALITQIESSFTQSDIYIRALQRLQERLGSQANSLQLLVNALGREAIRLTIKEFLSSIINPPSQDTSSCLDPSSPTFTIPPVPPPARSTRQTSTAPTHNTLVEQIEAVTPLVAQTSYSQQPQSSHQAGISIAIPDDPVLADEVGLEPTAIPLSTPLVLTDETPITPAPEESPEQPQAAIAPQAITKSNSQLVQDQASQSHVLPIKPHPEPATNRERELSSIGQQLYQARSQHGLSIEQLHQRTCVPSHHIRALEDGIWHHLPEDIYLKGFIRLLGNAVGLSGANLSQQLSVPTTESDSVPITFSRATQKLSPPHRSDQLKPSHLYLGYAALMAGATGGLAWMVSQPAPLSDSAAHTPESSTSPSLVNQQHSEKASLQVLAHKLVQQINAIATPETIPPEPTSRPINP